MAEPEEVEDVPDFNPVDFVAAARRRTMSTAVTSLEDDPEKASRALELAEATGENPAIVFNNLENFEQQHRTRLASSLLNSNEYLRRYIEDEPLAAKVSNDDYGQLDAVAEKAKGFGVDSVLSAAVKATKYYGAVTGETLKGAEEGFGYAALAKGHDELALMLAANPVFANLFIRQGVVAAADTFLGTMHAFNALITGAAAGIGEAYKQSGIQEFLPTEEARSRMRPETLARDLIVYAQVGLSGQAGLHGIVPPEVSAAITQAAQVAKAVHPYVAAGKEPPIGLHPIVDEIKVKQAKIDADNLGEALKEAAKSSTRERNPELFASYVRKITDGEIGISADAVRKLYGEKPPTPGEGPLGFVDDLADQLRRAEATGGDIKVTVADWLAKVEPEVAKELGDHVRARPEGVTVEEGKNLPKADAYHGSPYEFEAFNDSKIGSGQGAQSFAYGHYLAESPALAEKYRSQLAGEGGSVYGVRVKQPKESFLSWEQDLADSSVGKSLLEHMDSELKEHLQEDLDAHNQPALEDLTGGMLHRLLERYASEADLPGISDAARDNPRRAVAEYLASQGVPGIMFLDKKSRAIGPYGDLDASPRGDQPTRNFVVFSGKDIEVISRNGEAVRAIRQSAGLQGVQEGRFTLRPQEGFDRPTSEGGISDTKSHLYDILDERGNNLGYIALGIEKGGKRLYVDDMAADLGPRSLGPRAMRDLLEQLKEIYPGAETLEGQRVSGAREKAGLFEDKVLAARGLQAKDVGGARVDLTKIKPRKKPEQLELDVTRIEDKEAFAKASAIGMTVDQYKRYQKLIDKQHAEDVAYYTKRAEAAAKKKISVEWKEAELELRPEVARQINAQPDVAADNYLRTGYLYGDNVGGLKLNEGLLTPEQKAALPKEYYSKTGIHPDDLASLVGYPSGQVMINSLADFVAKRKASGMNPDNYRRRLIASEIERQVNERLGKRAEEILEEAKEQVLSETQQQLLHEQTLRLAEESGAEFSITKEDLIAGIQSVFERSRALDKAIASDTFLADAGRAGKAMEMALLKGDAAEAFRQSQRQYNAFTFAREAMKLEAERAKLEKITKKYTAREVKNREQSAVNYIQSLLSQAGVKIKLLPEEVQAAIQHEGYTSFADYVADKQQMGWEPAVSDQLQTSGAKRLEQMTVAEFREFKDAIDSLDFIGQKENKINLLGEALDWEEFRSKVIANLQTLPERPREGQGRWVYKLESSLVRMEELVKDFDLRQELGPIYSAVIEPMMKSKAMSFDLMTDLSNHFKKTRGDFGLRWRRSLSETIPQDFLIDSYSHVLLDMTRENLINVMLNWGNRSNIEKFTRGYASLELGRVATKEEAAAFEVKVKHLIDTHARKEDWDYVSRMWEPFKKWQPMIDTLSRNTSGVAPKWIKSEPVQTPHGVIEGGYWPVKYDRLGSDMSVIEDRKPNVDGLFGPSYIRATTAKGHLKERTGYVDFVDIHNSIEQAAGVMQQSIHDIAYRDALIQASKVFYDKPIRAAIRKYYGSEYEAQLIPWLKRIANQFTTNEAAIQGLNGWLRRVRINLVGHALPLNLKVILSPDIGVPNPKAWAAFEANRTENVKFAMEHSNEIRHLVYNMDRDFREQLERSIKNHTWDSIQAKAVQWGFTPVMKVSQEFRMSTFIDQWNKAKAEGRTDHEASVIADSYVRERHGAASIVDLPAIMESNEALKQITMFYGYFNTMYNWQRQLPGNIRRREVNNFMVNGLGSVVVGAAFGAALFNQAKESDSWWKVIGKALLLQPLGTIPIVRDAANYFMEGFPQRSPTGSLISAISSVATDIKRVAKGEKAKRPIQTTANVIGATTGLPLAQIGRTGQFAYDVQTGKQRPRNIIEYIRGIIHGEARLKP